MTADDVTTAQVLINYRRELLDAGVPDELVNEMTRDAAARLVQSKGLQTKVVPDKTH